MSVPLPNLNISFKAMPQFNIHNNRDESANKNNSSGLPANEQKFDDWRKPWKYVNENR